MSFWSAYAWTALVVANWLVVGYTVLWVRRDISDSRPPRASGLIPAATPGEPVLRGPAGRAERPRLTDALAALPGRGRTGRSTAATGGLLTIRMPDHLELSLPYAREAVPDETARRAVELFHDVPALFSS